MNILNISENSALTLYHVGVIDLDQVNSEEFQEASNSFNLRAPQSQCTNDVLGTH